MMKRALAALATSLIAGCGGAAPSTGARANEPRAQAGTDTTCVIHGLDAGQRDAFAAVAYDRYALLLPGSPTAWHSECPSSTGPYVYFGELDLRDGTIAASVEDVGSFEFDPFDERAYLGIFSELMLARPAHPSVTETTSLGLETLSNGHPAWFSSMTLLDAGVTLHAIHGYAVRPLSRDRVLVVHVSRTAVALEPDAKEDVARLLSFFGTTEELFDEGPRDASRP